MAGVDGACYPLRWLLPHTCAPAGPVEGLLAPVQGSWMKIADAAGFAASISAGQVIGIYKGQLNPGAWLPPAAGSPAWTSATSHQAST